MRRARFEGLFIATRGMGWQVGYLDLSWYQVVATTGSTSRQACISKNDRRGWWPHSSPRQRTGIAASGRPETQRFALNILKNSRPARASHSRSESTTALGRLSPGMSARCGRGISRDEQATGHVDATASVDITA